MTTDGLQLHLTGVAPSEAERFRAITVAGEVVDATRVIDHMRVAATEDLAAPRFSIEMLRNDAQLSLIGLVPTSTNREALIERLNKIPNLDTVTDLLETADYAAPESWQLTIDYAIAALRDLPRSKISLAAGEVTIKAMSDSVEDRRQLEAELKRKAPGPIDLVLDIAAPRPVIAPFTLRYIVDENGARFDACSADTEEARTRILNAARGVGLTSDARCTLGLGVPSTEWGAAASSAILALGRIGQGSVTLSDADISLIAAEGSDRTTFDRVVGELENALPDVFALTAVLPETESTENQGPAEFTATLSPEGLVQLRGRIRDELSRKAADSYSRAAFGSEAVYSAARLDDSLPEGWSLRVLAGLEALAQLNNGVVNVTEDRIGVRGNTGNKDSSAVIARILSDRLGEGQDFTIDVAYQEKLDPVAAIPTPDECIAEITAIQGERKINFEPGSATVDADSRGILDDLAEVLKLCGPLRLEIAGHTDSQGREEMNERLSQERANTVLSELRMRRVETGNFLSKGYGESTPIADNDTEEGREANRRIEFQLIRTSGEETDETTLESQSTSGAEESTDTSEADAEDGTGDETTTEEDGTEEPSAAEETTEDEQN